LHSKLVAGQCNIAWNALTSWNARNPVTRNGGSIYKIYSLLGESIFCIYFLHFSLMHSWTLIAVIYGIYAPSLPFEVRCESVVYNYIHHFDTSDQREPKENCPDHRPNHREISLHCLWSQPYKVYCPVVRVYSPDHMPLNLRHTFKAVANRRVATVSFIIYYMHA